MAEEVVRWADTKITLMYLNLEGGSVAEEIHANIKRMAFQSLILEKQSRVESQEPEGSQSLVSSGLGGSIICPNHFVAPNSFYDSSG